MAGALLALVRMRTALVTGANQGIGFALVEGLAARLDPDDLVLLTGRSPARVADAAARAAANPNARARVEGRVLDVGDPDAVAAFAFAADIVFSNAVTRMTPDTQAERADESIAVSNGGTHAVLRAFGPVLRPGGRLLVVASSLGTLDHLPPHLRPLFDNVSLDAVEEAVTSWRTALRDGTAEERGWPRWINIPSKVAQVAAVRAFAATSPPDTLIAAVCPGLVDTPTSRPWFTDFTRARTPAEAADDLLTLAFTTPPDPSWHGELVRHGQVLPWRGTPAA